MTATQPEAIPAVIDTDQVVTAVQYWWDLADDLSDFVFGPRTIPSESEAAFKDTMPAVCWAVPGAFAGPADC